MYCNGSCCHLDEKKHLCRLTGEGLAYMRRRGALSFIVHEHRGVCPAEEVTENGNELE